METIASASITSAFGNGFIMEFVRDSYGYIKNSSQFPMVQETILQLDLKNFIPVTQKFVDYLKSKNLAQHVEVARTQLQVSLNLIKDQLAFIYNILQGHQKKFLHKLRPPALGKHLQKLTILKNNADKQLNFLLMLTSPQQQSGNAEERHNDNVQSVCMENQPNNYQAVVGFISTISADDPLDAGHPLMR